MEKTQMKVTNMSYNYESNSPASGSPNSRAFGLVPGSNVLSEPQHRNNRNNNQSVDDQHARSDAALTTAGIPRQRRKWTNEINENLLRAYYIATDSERNLTGYRSQLHTIFVAQHPDFNVSEQRLSDQVRVIHRNNLIPEIRRNAIKDSLTVQQTPQSRNEEERLANNESNIIEENTDNREEIDDDHQFSNINAEFEQELEIYKNLSPLMRPSIPNIHSSKKLSIIINYLNTGIVAEKIAEINDLEDLNTLVYSAAMTVAKRMGCKIKHTCNTRISNKIIKNKTIQRIETKIKTLRSELERLNSFIAGNRSKRLLNKIRKILEKYDKHSRYESNNLNAILVKDTIRQKLKVQIARQRKYLLSNKRCRNNLKFSTNEKKFYRDLRNTGISNLNESPDTYPNRESVEIYWSDLWSNKVTHNNGAKWIKEEKMRYQQIEEMTKDYVTCEQVKQILAKTHNWKSPGIDRVQNFWYKRFSAVHQKLTDLLNDCIQNPSNFPQIFTKGITYLLPKNKGFDGNPANGRPITCLPTIYKILTACLNFLIYDHMAEHNIICEEQKGCNKNAKGCKEQLAIDQTVLEQAVSHSRNLNLCYIDYQKAFDSVPHSWLIEVLKIYKINPNIIKFLEYNMKYWRTSIRVAKGTEIIETSDIHIRRGIFQGDCLSALWFCIALNPLSNLLRDTKKGYKIKGTLNSEILSHLLYMDDLKIYSSTQQGLEHLIKIVSMFSNDIMMTFGLEKCRRIHIYRGKISKAEAENQETQNISQMEEGDVYKYLGINQSRRMDSKRVKTNLTREFKARIHKIAKANLNGKNLIKAINTYAVPILMYSFGIIKWTVTEIQSLQRLIRTMLTDYKFHHPKSCCERMIMPRSEGGRGLVDLQTLHDNQIESLRKYFQLKAERSRLIKTVMEADTNLTPLNLSGHFERHAEDKATREQRWAIKPIHGRYYRSIKANNVDNVMSNKWLIDGKLYAETEAFMIAIQDQIIPTKNYRKIVLKDPCVVNDACRRCFGTTETVDHIISGCTSMAQNEYTRRHNNVAKILHKSLLRRHGFETDKVPYYKYDPKPVTENENVKVYYDRTIYTDNTRSHNRPDITVINKRERSGLFIDVAIPATRNISRTYAEKINKYSELAVETKRNWNLKEIKIIPIVISAEGIIDKQLYNNIITIGLNKNIINSLQKSVILDTCRITRNFLN